MKIKELLTDESKWTKHLDARDKNGDRVSFHSSEAVSWCLVGALYRCYPPEQRDHVYRLLLTKIPSALFTWNDHQSRTFKDVKKLVEELDI